MGQLVYITLLFAPSNPTFLLHTLIQTIRSQYDFKFPTLERLNVRSRHPLFLVTDVLEGKHIIKLTGSENLPRIKREQKILSLLPKSFSYLPHYKRNKHAQPYTLVDTKDTILTVYKYIDGDSFRLGRNLSSQQLKSAAATLAKLHNLSIPFQDFNGEGVVKRDVQRGKKTYKEIIKNISKSSDPFDLMIYAVLTQRLARLAELETKKAILLENTESCSFVHGDYAPSNIIFSKNQGIHCIDWEHANVYAWQYDLFRACSNFSSSGRFTPYDSVKNTALVKRFLIYYFEGRNKVSQDEIEVLKCMPRVFCFIDTFPFRALYSEKQAEVEQYLPKNKKAYLWWKQHEKEFNELVQNIYEKTN